MYQTQYRWAKAHPTLCPLPLYLQPPIYNVFEPIFAKKHGPYSHKTVKVVRNIAPYLLPTTFWGRRNKFEIIIFQMYQTQYRWAKAHPTLCPLPLYLQPPIYNVFEPIFAKKHGPYSHKTVKVVRNIAPYLLRMTTGRFKEVLRPLVCSSLVR